VRDGTSWTQQAKLTANDAGGRFGRSVSISGDTAVVGAHHANSAYVFVRDGTTWTQQAKLTGSGWFGVDVSISVETILVGARFGTGATGNSGNAHVYVRDGTTWSHQAMLYADDGASGDDFGRHVALSGNTAIIGSAWDDDHGSRSGSAYIFERDGTSWSQQAKLTASDGAAGDWLGNRVIVDGDTAMAGAVFDDNEAGIDAGAAYVYKRDGTSWTEQARIIPSDAEAGDAFGHVSLSGDMAVIASSLAYFDHGVAYVYSTDGTSWTEQSKILASDGAPDDLFGGLIWLDGTTVVIGAPRDDDAGSRSGSAYVYELVPPNSPPIITAIAGPIDPIGINTPVLMTGTFTDPDSGDTHTATWNWGDSSESSGDVSDGTVTGSHPYSIPGVYTITLTVDDAAGESDTATYEQYVVIYDPTGAFVTGGGQIDSPPGAFPTDPLLTGKAGFGFVSKYHKGQTTPDGNTQFRFHAADFAFHSTSYDWMVVAGPKAIFKGSGEINGGGNYGFLLSAIDGDQPGGGGVDKFRIKIWDKDNLDTVVYDNGLGDADDADPPTELTHGSIKIHKA
jgi:hypothetical protein